jgi:L-lysine 6-transaminase
MAAVDLPDREIRDRVLTALRDDEHVLVLGSGERSVRFRPALSVTHDELDLATEALGRVLARIEEPQ